MGTSLETQFHEECFQNAATEAKVWPFRMLRMLERTKVSGRGSLNTFGEPRYPSPPG